MSDWGRIYECFRKGDWARARICIPKETTLGQVCTNVLSRFTEKEVTSMMGEIEKMYLDRVFFLIPEIGYIVDLNFAAKINWSMVLMLLKNFEPDKEKHNVSFTRNYARFSLGRKVKYGKDTLRKLVGEGWLDLTKDARTPCHAPFGGCCFVLPEPETIELIETGRELHPMKQQILRYLTVAGRFDLCTKMIQKDLIVYLEPGQYTPITFNPLTKAIKSNNGDMVTALMERREVVGMLQHRSVHNKTPFWWACKRNYQIALTMADHPDVVLEADSFRKNSPLHLACGYRDDRLALKLLARGADGSAVNSVGVTPLWNAVANRLETVAKKICENYTGPLNTKVGGKTLFHWAIILRWKWLIDFLMSKRAATITVADNHGKTPVSLCITLKQIDTAWFLLADPRLSIENLSHEERVQLL